MLLLHHHKIVHKSLLDGKITAHQGAALIREVLLHHRSRRFFCVHINLNIKKI